VSDPVIDSDLASQLAALPLAHLRREFPHKLDHVAFSDIDISPPHLLHPAFYGCFDWHSAVHGHWMLARLDRVVPGLRETGAIHALFDETLTAVNLAVEAAYFEVRPAFERTYGWAWLLELARELEGTRWAANLDPLVEVIVRGYMEFLPKQRYPIRGGVHANTAFGLAFALDYARATHHLELEALIVERARAYYGGDTDVPAQWEPGGEDFLSPALVEADLMRRVLPAAELEPWLQRFLPSLPPSLQHPAVVDDREDPKLAHLDGLNLSRAWCMRSLAAALPPTNALRPVLVSAAAEHTHAGLAHVATGSYAGEHWLASFAVYLLGTP
jgi:hypothetical protein